jgi:hypothetical protein
MKWQKILVNHISVAGLTMQHIKRTPTQNKYNLILKWAKEFSFFKDDIEMLISI